MEVFKMDETLTSIFFILLSSFCMVANCRIYNLDLKEDNRKEIQISTFGFLKKGTLVVNLTYFGLSEVSPKDINDSELLFGFTLDKSGSSGISSYMEDNQGNCILSSPPAEYDHDNSVSIVAFRMDFKRTRIDLKRFGKDVQHLSITHEIKNKNLQKRQSMLGAKKSAFGDSDLMKTKTDLIKTKKKAKRAAPAPLEVTAETTTKGRTPTTSTTTASTTTTTTTTTSSSNSTTTPTKRKNVFRPPPPRTVNATDKDHIPMWTEGDGFATYFEVSINTDSEEGLYNLYFHNCYNYGKQDTIAINLQMKVMEDNNGNYLSAGGMPIPTLFFGLSVVYLAVAIFWMVVLRKASEDVYKMHYLMFFVVMVKSLACLFHAINSHFISIEGIHEEAWAVLYYIVYLTRGALLFTTILLIGAGWAFIKHILSDKEKKLFLVVIPLQVLDNIAFIIVEESQEGQSEYAVWKETFIIVDLLCCGAILFPVVWSIRHLQQAAKTDGKAAISLQKLKLFRQFYIMVVCYIYFTRIIVCLISITVPFKYEWLDELFKECATIIFFVITGYKFRPAPDNPYLQVPQDSDEEVEMEEVLTESGALENLKRVNQKTENTTQPKQRESSHEYD